MIGSIQGARGWYCRYCGGVQRLNDKGRSRQRVVYGVIQGCIQWGRFFGKKRWNTSTLEIEVMDVQPWPPCVSVKLIVWVGGYNKELQV